LTVLRCLSFYSKMSQVPPILNLKEEDVKKMIVCDVHLGSTNIDSAMVRYAYERNDSGVHVIDVKKTWEKLQLAARVIAAVENPKDVCVVALSTQTSGAPIAQRAVLKFAKYIGCRTIVGRITPGTFTNYQQSNYFEPRLLVTSDPRIDHQPIVEASYVNMPVISFANINSSLRGVDIAIPCNTEGKYSIALMYWMLAREVLRLSGRLTREKEWEVMVDMFVYRDAEEQEKQTEDPSNNARFFSSQQQEVEWDGEQPEGGEVYGTGENQVWESNQQWGGQAGEGAEEYYAGNSSWGDA